MLFKVSKERIVMDPTLRPRIIACLKDRIGTFAPQMAVAAKYVIDHPADFGLDPVRETARKAKVSTYTLVKMSKNLGFDTYEEFRAPFRSALTANSPMSANPTWLDDIRHESPTGAVFADAAENAVSVVQKSLQDQSCSELAVIADALLAAGTVYVTGVRASYAMAYYLHYVGRMALPGMELVPRNMGSAIDDLNDAVPGDVLVAITVTPYSRETLEACAFAKSKGLKLIIISDSEVISPDLDPDHSLVASVLSTHHFACYAGMTAVIETLIALLVDRGAGDARVRIASYDTLRRSSNAYWPARKNNSF